MKGILALSLGFEYLSLNSSKRLAASARHLGALLCGTQGLGLFFFDYKIDIELFGLAFWFLAFWRFGFSPFGLFTFCFTDRSDRV